MIDSDDEATSMNDEQYHQITKEAAALFGFGKDYEFEQLAYFGRALADKICFLDVGANRGLYAYLANLVIQNGYIALIEANPTLAEVLRYEVQTWPKQNGNTIEVFGVAAGDVSTMLPFFFGGIDTVGTLTKKDSLRVAKQMDIACEPLDKLFAPRDQTLIKIDVEGFEYRAIVGAKELIAKNTRVFVELHGWGDAEKGKYPFHVLQLMNSLGFSVRRIGTSYAYDFTHASFMYRSLSFLRWAPPLAIKFLIRRSGLRPFLYKMFGHMFGH